MVSSTPEPLPRADTLDGIYPYGWSKPRRCCFREKPFFSVERLQILIGSFEGVFFTHVVVAGMRGPMFCFQLHGSELSPVVPTLGWFFIDARRTAAFFLSTAGESHPTPTLRIRPRVASALTRDAKKPSARACGSRAGRQKDPQAL